MWAGGVFHAFYTLRNAKEFFGAFADGAWASPSRSFVRAVVIPNGKLFTALLIGFQVAVAVGILSALTR